MGLFVRDVLQAMRRGQLEIDVAEMELQQDVEDGPRIYRGPGRIFQDADGRIMFRLYVIDGPELDPSDFSHEADLAPGSFLEAHHYYILRARDYEGQTWSAKRIRPSVFSGSEGDVNVSGSIQILRLERDRGCTLESFLLTLAIYENVEFPCNSQTIITTRVARREWKKSSSLNVARFRAAGIEFVLYHEGDVSFVRAESNRAFPEHVEVRIVESLLFVLGRPLWWRESVRRSGSIETVELRSPIAKARPVRLQRPIDPQHDAFGVSTWHLFDRYLRFIQNHGKPTFHPISKRILSACEASLGSPGDSALAICVAIEGLRNDFIKIGALKLRSSRLLEASVDEIREFLLSAPEKTRKRWEKAGINEARLKSLIGGLKNISPQSHFYALANRGWVTSRLVDTWRPLRTSRAHALNRKAKESSEELRELVRHRADVLILMYQLVFWAIKYRGSFTNYSEHGWPPQLYPPRKSTAP
jgi:hypothetical protein